MANDVVASLHTVHGALLYGVPPSYNLALVLQLARQ